MLVPRGASCEDSQLSPRATCTTLEPTFCSAAIFKIPLSPREAQRGQRRTAAANAPAYPGTGNMAAVSRQRLLCYHAMPTNFRALGAFRLHITRLWRRVLRRRSQKDGRMAPHGSGSRSWSTPFCRNPVSFIRWPSDRFAVKHLRWGAVCGKSARTDLCWGAPRLRLVMDVPTAIWSCYQKRSLASGTNPYLLLRRAGTKNMLIVGRRGKAP